MYSILFYVANFYFTRSSGMGCLLSAILRCTSCCRYDNYCLPVLFTYNITAAGQAAGQQQPQAQQQQQPTTVATTAAGAATQPDYTAQWAEYYRQMGYTYPQAAGQQQQQQQQQQPQQQQQQPLQPQQPQAPQQQQPPQQQQQAF